MKAVAKKIAFILIPHFMAEGEEMRLITKKESHLAKSIPKSIPMSIPKSIPMRITSVDRVKSTPPLTTAREGNRGTSIQNTPEVTVSGLSPRVSFLSTREISPVPNPEERATYTHLRLVSGTGGRGELTGITRVKGINYIPAGASVKGKACESGPELVPLIIASGTKPKSIVLDYSIELEHTPNKNVSIKKGQYLKDIASLIEGAKVIPVDHEYIEELNRKVTGYLRNFSPTIENPSPGSYYIDLTGTRRLFGREIDTCGRIIRGLKAMGFTARCGVGSTTLIARLASEVAGDCAVYEVFEPSENLFITPLSITLLPDLPLPVQNELREDYNIRKIGELLGFSKNDLRHLFGKTGELLYEYSRGRARNTLYEKKTEEVLRWEFVVNSEGNDNRVLRRRFFDMLAELCTTLRREYRVPRRAELTVVYRDNYRYITGGKLSHPSFFEEELYRELVFYLNRALQRRTSVKKFIICLSRFTTPSFQLELFENALKATELSRACDLIREKYGSGSIACGV